MFNELHLIFQKEKIWAGLNFEKKINWILIDKISKNGFPTNLALMFFRITVTDSIKKYFFCHNFLIGQGRVSDPNFKTFGHQIKNGLDTPVVNFAASSRTFFTDRFFIWHGFV